LIPSSSRSTVLDPSFVATTRRPRSPWSETTSPSTWPTRYTGFRGRSPSARRSAFFEIEVSIARRTSDSAEKKRSAGTMPSSDWCGLKKL
jgi:hypothetical protein